MGDGHPQLPRQAQPNAAPWGSDNDVLKTADPTGHGASASRLMRESADAEEPEQRHRRVMSIEKQLTVLTGERTYLETVLQKFPSNSAGRTVAERRQKRDAEERLEEVETTLRELRLQLRQINPK